MKRVFANMEEAKMTGQKRFGVLIDPEAREMTHLDQISELGARAGVDFFLIGGSLLMDPALDEIIRRMKSLTEIPLVLFPGNNLQISDQADALLLLSLVSGRNPELLIGQHVVAAPRIAATSLEVIPTAYILVDGGSPTSVQYMSHTQPIPADKGGIAACTALAAEQLGMKCIYLDAGSGAQNAVPNPMIREVRAWTKSPIIVGGGIRSAQEVFDNGRAGADVIIVGNAIEKDPGLMVEMGLACKESSTVN